MPCRDIIVNSFLTEMRKHAAGRVDEMRTTLAERYGISAATDPEKLPDRDIVAMYVSLTQGKPLWETVPDKERARRLMSYMAQASLGVGLGGVLGATAARAIALKYKMPIGSAATAGSLLGTLGATVGGLGALWAAERMGVPSSLRAYGGSPQFTVRQAEK